MDTVEQSTQNTPESRPPSYVNDEQDTFSLLDTLLLLTRNIKLIGMSTAIFVLFGLLVAVFSPPKYTASVRVVRETATERTGGLAGGLAALRGLGISIGGGSVGLTAETYPDILMSREVLLAVARSSFYFNDLDARLSLVEYYNQPPGVLGSLLGGLKSITIGLPGTIMRLFQSDDSRPRTLGNMGEFVYPTKEDEDTLERLRGLVRVNVDRNTGIMSIAVTTHDPLLSAQLAQVLIQNLTQRVRAIYTQKAYENLGFIQARFAEVNQELETAEEELAVFMDRNRNPQTVYVLVIQPVRPRKS